ncbi:hypothetical protein GC175_33265 [bacterium]|nr:hypothetical protein [bacterium]
MATLENHNPFRPSSLRSGFSRRTFLRNTALLTVGGALAACAPAAEPATEAPAAESSAPSGPASGGTLTYVMPSEPATLDPHVSSSRYDGQVLFQICNTLMYWDNNLTLTPGLATEWGVGDDGLTYTLKLREDVTFHDGTPFNAEAVVRNLERIMDPETKSEGARFSLGPYESSRAVDEFTLEVKTSEPFGPMITALGGLYIISPAAIDEYGQDLYNHPVGTGPFVFKEWIPKSQITLEKNPDYNWAPSVFQHEGPAYVDELIIKFITEESTRLAVLEADEADVILVVPPDQIERLQGDPDFDIYTTVVAGISPHLAFNNQKEPMNDPKFRQALMYALNKEELNLIVNYGVWEIESGALSSKTPMYAPDHAVDVRYPYNADMANQLLDELGWLLDTDGLRKKDGEPLTLIYLTLPTAAGTAEAVQAQLLNFGITVEILAQANPAQQTSAQQGVHDMVWMQWSGLDPAIMRTVFHSSNAGVGWNFSHYKSDSVDALLEEQAQATDPAQRAAIFAEVQKTIMDDAAIYPLWPLNRIWGVRSNIDGFSVHPGGEVFIGYDIYFTS